MPASLKPTWAGSTQDVAPHAGTWIETLNSGNQKPESG